MAALAARPSGWSLLLPLLAAGAVRLALAVEGSAGLTLADLAVVGVTALAAGPGEWAAHRQLFHAPAGSWRRRIGLGSQHRRHHASPDTVDHLLLRPGAVVGLQLALGAVSLLWAGPIVLLSGAPVAGPLATAAAAAWLVLARYEWSHLLFHSRCRPLTARGRRLAAAHLRHHHRDASRWFGVTSGLTDRLLGTA